MPAVGDYPRGLAPHQSQAVPVTPGSTGHYLVSFRKRDPKDAVKDLESVAGIPSAAAAFTRDYDNRAAGLAAETGSSLLVFERLRVAVVEADPEQVQAVSAAHVDLGLSALEPERYVYADTQPSPVDPYTQGWKDGAAFMADLFARQMPGGPGLLAPPGLLVPGGTGVLPVAPLSPAFGTAPTSYAPPPPRLGLAPNWALDAIGMSSSARTGAGVRLAVLDTGLDLRHPDLGNRPVLAESLVPGEDVQDVLGHGTHCAGIACGPVSPSGCDRYGVAPDAELIVGKILEQNQGSAPMRRVLAGIDWAVFDADASVVSMSFATKALPGEPYSQIFEDTALVAREDAGAVLVAAAGNDSSRHQGFIAAVGQPASSPSVIAVGALTPALTVADFSNGSHGYKVGQVDIAAPGVGILSAWPGLTPPYAYKDGTSMATPFVAGVLALLLEIDPGATATEVINELLRCARRLPSCSSADVGAGLVQAP